MNFSIIRRTLGFLLLFEAIFFLIPAVTAVCYQEWQPLLAFVACIAICGGVGGLCVLKQPKNRNMYAKEGFAIVALSWIVLSFFGAFPFLLTGTAHSFIDALFETVSGFTTTGASIFSGDEIDGMAKSLLMWRSFTHWVGGMGVLVFVMAFLPLSGAQNMHLMKAESPGPVVSKLVPKVRQTAFILYAIYSVLTMVEFVMLLCGGMTVFEALNSAFATAGTGGFSFSSQGMAYGPYIQIVVTVFMLLFSINFTSYYLILCGKPKEAWSAEVRTFIIIVFSAILLIACNVHFAGDFEGKGSFGDTLRQAAFYVASIISTSGFGIEVDFSLWPQFSISILVILMFVGACAGSTGGGMKLSRWMILAKGGAHEVGRLIHPKQVKKIIVDGKVVEHEVVRSVNAYLVAFILIFVGSLLLISFDPLVQGDFTTAFTSVLTTMNNVGPGIGPVIGPNGNFSGFTDFSKIVYIFNMLAGRLELFPVLVLFAPSTWRK
jgi:trk system potassium uptake protein TrkH